MITDKIAIISQETIASLGITPSECIKWVEEGFLKKDLAQMPAKISVHPQGEDFITTMPRDTDISTFSYSRQNIKTWI